MRNKLVSDKPKTWVLVFDPGDEPVSILTNFAREHSIRAAQICGIGGFSDAKLAYFDIDEKEYKPIEIREQVEVTSFLGNLSIYQNEPKLHAHCVIGRRNGDAITGHLLEGHVQPTLEIFLTAYDQELRRELDPAPNLPLLKP